MQLKLKANNFAEIKSISTNEGTGKCLFKSGLKQTNWFQGNSDEKIFKNSLNV